MNAATECRSQSGSTLTIGPRFAVDGSFRRLNLLHVPYPQGGMRKDMDVDSYEHVLKVLEPYWRDLLRQGGIYDVGDRSPTPTYVLKFRQRFSGTRDGRQKTIYVGKRKEVADRLMKEIWRRREQAGTRIPPLEYQRGRESEHDRSIADFVALLEENPSAPLADSRNVEIERLVELERKLKEGG